MLSYVEENPLITLKEIHKKFVAEENLNVSTTTIHNHLNAKFYTVKKILAEPNTMNNDVNKSKRVEYVSKVMSAIGEGKTIIYIDETNCNLFIRRSFGRSIKGTRCAIKAPTAKGKNVHVLAGITQTGIVYWERRRGSYLREDCNEWMRTTLRQVNEPMENVVIVCDNAPVHVRLETVVQEEEFEGATILRSGPYSAL